MGALAPVKVHKPPEIIDSTDPGRGDLNTPLSRTGSLLCFLVDFNRTIIHIWTEFRNIDRGLKHEYIHITVINECI